MSKFTQPSQSAETAFSVAKEGYPFIFSFAFATVVFALLGFAVPSMIFLAAAFFTCWFFRDPRRVVPGGADLVVSPADGRIIAVLEMEKNRFSDGRCIKISIFMSLFNAHINRIPHEGEVVDITYYPGKFFSANLDKASKLNEHNAVFLKTEKGHKICFVQIAGLVARRIKCYVHKGDKVDRGQRFGLICFGSRVDIYMPAGSMINVNAGDRVKAGVSILGVLP